MTREEIQKALYKENPIAKQTAVYRDGGSKDYETTLKSGEVLKFHVPIEEQKGDRGILPEFQSDEIKAKYLIRWLQ